jgi:hypothetical protein
VNSGSASRRRSTSLGSRTIVRPDEAAAASCWEGRQLASGCGRSRDKSRNSLRRPATTASRRKSGRSLAPRHQATWTEALACMAANEGNRQSLPAVSAHPASVARTTVSRQSPDIGARCGSNARRDLCGGRPAMAVPTATAHTACGSMKGCAKMVVVGATA